MHGTDAAHNRSVSPGQVLLLWAWHRGVAAIPKSITKSRIQENYRFMGGRYFRVAGSSIETCACARSAETKWNVAWWALTSQSTPVLYLTAGTGRERVETACLHGRALVLSFLLTRITRRRAFKGVVSGQWQLPVSEYKSLCALGVCDVCVYAT